MKDKLTHQPFADLKLQPKSKEKKEVVDIAAQLQQAEAAIMNILEERRELEEEEVRAREAYKTEQEREYFRQTISPRDFLKRYQDIWKKMKDAKQTLLDVIQKEFESGKDVPIQKGVYDLKVRYPVRSGETTEKHMDQEVFSDEWTLHTLKQEARNHIIMFGIHNFGFRYGPMGSSRVTMELTKKDDATQKFSTFCYIGAGGHLARKDW